MRTRVIKPGFFKNDDLAECSPHARLVFIGLWCMADRDGRLEDKPRRIKAELFPFESVDINALLTELVRTGFLTRYVAGGLPLLQVNNFLKHQAPHFREPKGIYPPPGEEDKTPVIHTPPTPDNSTPDLAFQCSTSCDASTMDELSMHDASVISPRPSLPYTVYGIRYTVSKDSPPPDGGGVSSTSRVPASLALVSTPSGETTAVDAPSPPAPQGEPEEPARTKGRKLPECPHQDILDLWAELLPTLPQHLPGFWRGARAEHLKARWRETAVAEGWTTRDEGLAWFRNLFAYVGRSSFLTGRSSSRGDRPPFKAELEWLVKPANWVKVIEGKYEDAAA